MSDVSDRAIVYKCRNCGRIHETDHKLISLNGIDFCGDCSDEFHFLKDDYLGFIALKEEF